MKKVKLFLYAVQKPREERNLLRYLFKKSQKICPIIIKIVGQKEILVEIRVDQNTLPKVEEFAKTYLAGSPEAVIAIKGIYWVE
jgi:hypothetical protein